MRFAKTPGGSDIRGARRASARPVKSTIGLYGVPSS